MERNDNQSKRKTGRLLIFLLVLLTAGYFGYRSWAHAQRVEETDNAQLDATIISVRTSVSGYIKEVRFSDNQRVKKGDTLVVIDPADYQARVLQAQALLKSAEAQTGVSRNAAEAAAQNAAASSLNSSAMKAGIESANARQSKAVKDLGRIKSMFAKGAATQQSLDAAVSELQSADAQVQMTTRQYEASLQQKGSVQSNAKSQQEQVGISNASVQQRLAELKLAESQLEHTVIVAPFDGIVSKKSVESGQYIQASQPVCSEVESDELWVTAIFKETQLGRIKTGQTAHIRVDAFPDLTLNGSVESIGAATGAKFSLLPPDNATGNFVKVTQRIPVRIRLDNPDVSAGLAPGMSVLVEVEVN